MRTTFGTTFIILLIAFWGSAQAQTSSIQGLVLDNDNNEPLIGATVSVLGLGTAVGTFTDFDGTYTLNNLTSGAHRLIISYIGYISDTVDIIIPVDSNISEFNFGMSANVNHLDEVVVSAVRKTSTDVAVLNTIRSSMQIVSGLSAETIKRTLDSDASQVVRRIPGVTILDNRFIVIRGLNERYNSTLFHNVNIPSMEADVRSFSFDMIPSQVIDQVLIYKSPAPELPGDFSGGAVKVSTISIPDETNVILDVSMGYRKGSSLRDFKAETRNPGYWTGINRGYNDLPSNFPERLTGLTESQIAEVGRTLPNNWKESDYMSGMDYKVALTFNYRKDLGREMQLGNVTSLFYSNAKTVFAVTNRSYEAYDFVGDQSILRYNFDDREYEQEIMGNALHNWAFRFNRNNIIEFKNLLSYLTTYQFVERYGDQVAQGFTQNSFAFFNEYRGLYSGQLMGSHQTDNGATKINWVGGYGFSYNELPDYRRYRRNVIDPLTRESVLFVPSGQTPDFLGKFYSDMSEQMFSGAFNVEHQTFAGRKSGFRPLLKAGMYVEDRYREFNARNLGFTRGFGFNPALTELGANELFDPANINPEGGIRLGENFSTSNFFVATNRLLAYYASASIPMGRFTLMGGIRLEDNTQRLRSPDRFVEGTNTPPIEPVVIPQTILLPSATLSYDLSEKSVLKAVYGKTVNRPEFREIAPFGFYDFIFDATITGHTFLQNATIDNFDLRWEYYPSPRETFSVALFRKNFLNPIESLYGNFGSEQPTFLFRNVESAVASGVEIDLRKSLNGLTTYRFLNRISVLGNFSIVDSRVTLGEDLSTLLRAGDRPLQGQSGFIVNTGLFYDDEERNYQVNLMYNVIGKRILLVGAGAIPDTYELPRNVLDLSFRKVLTNSITLKLGIKDLLNQEILLLQDGNEDGKLDRKNDQIFRSFRPGTVYSIGLTLKL